MSSYPELYTLKLKIDELPYRRSLYKNVEMHLFRHDMPPHDLDYSQLIAGSLPALPGESWGAYEYCHESINELFTLEEAQEVIAYFERHHYEGTVMSRELFTDWPCVNDYPTGAIPVGGYGPDYWMFDREEHFDCPVKFWGYYDVRGYEEIEVRRLVCKPSGAIDLDGYSLTLKQAQRLFSSWLRAQEDRKTVETTVRLERPTNIPVSARLDQSLDIDEVFPFDEDLPF